MTQTESPWADGGLNWNPSRRPGLVVSDSSLHAVKTGHSELRFSGLPYYRYVYVSGIITYTMVQAHIMHCHACRRVSASAADWPKRIRDMQYVDHDDFAAAHWGPP